MIELGRLGVWGHLDSLTADEARAYVRRAEGLGYGTLWVPETVGREPFALLGMLAGETSSLLLGTSIVAIWGHDAQTTRMAALTLQEATAGRFVLGLGVSHPHLAQRLRGHTFERPLSHMREYLTAYRAAVYKGPTAPKAPEPPILLAALRERMLTLAATAADGAFPYLVGPNRLAWMRSVLDAANAERRPLLAVSLPAVVETNAGAARSAARGYLAPYLRTPAYQAGWALQGFEEADWEQPGSDRLVDAMVAWGDVETLRDRTAELVAAGADHVALIPLSPEGVTENLAVLEAMAGD
ncbi:MAG TPA: LLM class flavin-dependent oxidoreductase [Candidatus Limnocylindria bacterium]|jgi:probable F420-dependent oxidoreductase